MRILQYNAKGMAQVSFFDLVDVDTIVTDFSVLNIVETIDQVCDGCFTGTGRTGTENQPRSMEPTKAIFCPGVA